MIKLEVEEGRNLVYKGIEFETATAIIKLQLSNTYKEIKTVFEIPCYKGIGLHQVTTWDLDNIKCELSNGNFFIEDGKNTLVITKDANIIIMDRKKSEYCFKIVLEDYHMAFVCRY